MNDLISKAVEYAVVGHHGQNRRYNGLPYIVHPLRVMLRVMAATADEDVIAAAVLHDVIEDCGVEVQEIETRFGAPVAALVEMLTNESKGLFAHRSDRKKADLNRISDASRDVRLVKLADRLDNVRDLGGAPPKFVELYLAESEALLALLWGRTDEAIEEELGKAIEEARAKL